MCCINALISSRFMASGLILACLLATSPEHSAGQIRSRLWEATRNGTANNGKLRQSSSFDLINLIKDREAQDTRPTPSPQDEAKAAASRKAVQEAEQLANTLKDLPRAIAKFEEALALYKSIKDDRGEVAALTGIAASHNAQGDMKR